MKTLDEAILHCYEKAGQMPLCDCSKEHIQLAQWLEELKMYKELYPYPCELEAFLDRSNPNRSFPPYICPGCGVITHLFDMGKPYCPYCGQKVKVKK